MGYFLPYVTLFLSRHVVINRFSIYLFRSLVFSQPLPPVPNLFIQSVPISVFGIMTVYYSTMDVGKPCLSERDVQQAGTLHGFRSGCAISPALTGTKLMHITEHVGCNRQSLCLLILRPVWSRR